MVWVNLILFDSSRAVLTLGTSSESGLKRVPLEGPPTWRRMSSTAFSALREAYENNSFGRGCGAVGLAGWDF